LLNTTSFTSATAVAVDNVFSSNYDNYKIILSVASGANNQLFMRMRAGGVPNNSTQYKFGNYYVGTAISSPAGSENSISATNFWVGNTEATVGGGADITMYKPFLTQHTSFTTTATGHVFVVGAGNTTVTTSYDGFTIYPSSSNFTGTVRVYGLRNS
jgi:hypothetical protein